MPDERRSVTAIQVVASVITLLAIGGIIWTVGYGGDFLKDAERVNGLIKLSAAILVIAITFIVVFYLISGSNTTDESKTFRLEFMRIVMGVTPMQWVASLIGLFTIGGIIWVIGSGDDILQDAEKTRGLITFSVAIVTVAIALILVFYLIFGSKVDNEDKDEVKNRFTFGKDILMVFVGILGTVMGFYYGAENLSKDQLKNIADVVQKPAGQQNSNPEQTALDLLIKKDFEGAAKAFDDAFNTTPALPNVGNIDGIRKILAKNKEAYTKAASETEKQPIWQAIFCEISNNKLTAGMTDEMKKTVDGYCKPPPVNTPTNSNSTQP